MFFKIQKNGKVNLQSIDIAICTLLKHTAKTDEKFDKQDMIKYTRSFVDDIENSFNIEIEIEQDLDWSGVLCLGMGGSGAGGDFQQVDSMARQMVTRFGMSELGPIALEGGNQEVFVGRDLMTRSEVSDSISKQIDESVRVMVKDCYKQTYSIISENREAMDKIVDILIERETLDGDEFVNILSKYTSIPEKDRTPQLLN